MIQSWCSDFQVTSEYAALRVVKSEGLIHPKLCDWCWRYTITSCWFEWVEYSSAFV